MNQTSRRPKYDRYVTFKFCIFQVLIINVPSQNLSFTWFFGLNEKMFYLVAMVTKFKNIPSFSWPACHDFCHQILLKYTKKCYYIMFLAILPEDNYLNGAKLSENIFHFHSRSIFILPKLINFQNHFTFLLSVYPMMHLEKTIHFS